ncbi:MAG: hypothetical protein ACLTYN_10330 [Dysosmobacter welbionis]
MSAAWRGPGGHPVTLFEKRTAWASSGR